MVMASIQPSTFSPFTVRLLALLFTASTLPWNVNSFLPEPACPRQTAAIKRTAARTEIDRRSRCMMHLQKKLKIISGPHARKGVHLAHVHWARNQMQIED